MWRSVGPCTRAAVSSAPALGVTRLLEAVAPARARAVADATLPPPSIGGPLNSPVTAAPTATATTPKAVHASPERQRLVGVRVAGGGGGRSEPTPGADGAARAAACSPPRM